MIERRFETERLVVRPITDADYDALWAYRGIPEVNEWLGRAPATREAFGETYAESPRHENTLAVTLRDDPTVVIGDLMLAIEDGWAQAEVLDAARGVQAELGWAFDPAYTGQGLATEAVRGLITFCFRTLGLRRVHAGCFSANEPSWRLMDRLGMRREEDSRQSGLHRSGEWMDGLNYALLADELAGSAEALTPVTHA